jgi:ribonuclease HI
MPVWKESDDEEGRATTTAECRCVVFTDGSCLEQGDERIRSPGCGTFVAKGHPWNLAFALPGIVQSSELGEARAAVHILEAATAHHFDVEVRLDNETVVDTLAKIVRGEEVEYEKGRMMWRRAKKAIESRKAEGGQGHVVTWIPGHTKLTDVEEGRTTEENRRGNEKVDELAKQGARANACPQRLVDKAKRRKEIGKVLHDGFADILIARRTVMSASTMTAEDEDEYPEDPWATQPGGPRCNRLGLAKRRAVKEVEVAQDESAKQDRAAMRAIWPDYQWHQKEEDFTLRRSGEDNAKGGLLDADTTKALKWYWNQLHWRAEEDVPPDDVGVSWKELAADFWAATGLITRFPRNKARETSWQHMAEAFAKASRRMEEEETASGTWLWRGVCDRTSALAPFGQKAAVTGLKRRPRLVCGETVGFTLCRAAAAAAQGKPAETVEEWRRDQPPIWRRWRKTPPA